MHACIVVSLMAGVRPEEARAIGWEQDVDLDGTPPSVAVLRADRPGRHRDAEVPPRAEAGAAGCRGLREWQADEAVEREAAGSHWQENSVLAEAYRK
jgi:hypothetical protein